MTTVRPTTPFCHPTPLRTQSVLPGVSTSSTAASSNPNISATTATARSMSSRVLVPPSASCPKRATASWRSACASSAIRLWKSRRRIRSAITAPTTTSAEEPPSIRRLQVKSGTSAIGPVATIATP